MPLSIDLRPLSRLDGASFADFVNGVATGEQRFLKEDLTEPSKAFAQFWSDATSRRMVALEGDTILGLAGAFPGIGWSSHVAEIRVLVSPAHRRRGVGRQLARAALRQALGLGCSHAYVEVVAEQDGLIAMFQDLGFEPEALLADFVRETSGALHDLMILTFRAADSLGRNQAYAIDEIDP